MSKRFVIKPTDEVVSEAESWLGFRDNDPVRIETDELYHLIHGADNVLMLEAQASGEKRMAAAIEALTEQAQQVAPLFDFNTGDTYLLQVVVGVDTHLQMEEFAAVSDMISSLQKKADITWGFSYNDSNGDAVILRLAVNNLQPVLKK